VGQLSLRALSFVHLHMASITPTYTHEPNVFCRSAQGFNEHPCRLCQNEIALLSLTWQSCDELKKQHKSITHGY